MYRGWYDEMIEVLDAHIATLRKKPEILPMGRYQLDRIMTHARMFRVLEPAVQRGDVSRRHLFQNLCKELLQQTTFVDWRTAADFYLDAMFEGRTATWSPGDFPPRNGDVPSADLKRAARMGAEFVLWAAAGCRIPLGRAECYREHAFRYAERQARTEAPCFQVDASRMDLLLSDLCARRAWLDRDLAREYLQALPLFSQFLRERGVVKEKKHESAMRETTRLWDTLSRRA